MTESKTDLCGSMTALVTPFRGGEIDWAAVESLVDRQVDGGTDWLVPVGTTGEAPTLSRAEREKLLDVVIARAAGRCPVMAGTGSNNTADTVERTKQAASAGAAAVLVVAPYYNRPTQEGLFRHFAAVAQAVQLPIVLYNVPARTGVTIGNDVVVRLSEAFPNVAAIKDATGTVAHVPELISRSSIAILSGDDSLTWPFLASGAVGVISVLANLVPALMKSLVEAGLQRDMEVGMRLHRKVCAVADGIGEFGPNPVPIKTAMNLAGLIEDEFRLPLCRVDKKGRAAIDQVLRKHELLERAGV